MLNFSWPCSFRQRSRYRQFGLFWSLLLVWVLKETRQARELIYIYLALLVSRQDENKVGCCATEFLLSYRFRISTFTHGTSAAGQRLQPKRNQIADSEFYVVVWLPAVSYSPCKYGFELSRGSYFNHSVDFWGLMFVLHYIWHLALFDSRAIRWIAGIYIRFDY